MEQSGKLYIVGTPIGNLGDISARALKTLEMVSFIAAEDTRVTLKLLSKYNIKKPLVSCHKFNICETAEQIAKRLLNGESCAVVTDAGMPCISDPGAEVVELCAQKGIKTEVIPGPSAVVSALALCGFSCSRFSFEGFLSVNTKQRKICLEKIKNYDGLLIFYEAPHKLIRTLTDLHSALGDREIAVCREMTKIHEEVLRGSFPEIISHFEKVTPKGEFVLVIKNVLINKTDDNDAQNQAEQAVKKAAEMIKDGFKPADACKIIAGETGIKKSLIYKALLEIKD